MAPQDDEPLAELELARHRDLIGRRWGPVTVRMVIAILAAFVGLAALNVFGQQPSTSSAAGPTARMDVSTPSRLRGGLIFQTRVDVQALRPIAKPTLVLGGGWFDGMTLNSYQPPAANQASRGEAVTFSYPPLAAGAHMTVWLEWSVNPTNVAWDRAEPIQVDDGRRQLVRLAPTVTVFP
ncbi:MAG: hypothetical protein ABJB93_01550 [Gaiellales bacterium]